MFILFLSFFHEIMQSSSNVTIDSFFVILFDAVFFNARTMLDSAWVFHTHSVPVYKIASGKGLVMNYSNSQNLPIMQEENRFN